MSFKPLIVLESSRVCHVCRLGSQLEERIIGAMVIYVGLEHEIAVHFGDDQLHVNRIIAIEPYRRHRISAGRQYVCTILVEPESVTDDCVRELLAQIHGAPLTTGTLAGLLDFLVDASHNPASLTRRFRELSFDRLIFNHQLDARYLDQRIQRIVEMLDQSIDGAIRWDGCAREVALSASRFGRLFRESTGVQFRHYRMWKRARTYLHHIKNSAPLTQIALDLGYPDSTHFSHSIRRTYGLAPRRMKVHMQRSIFFFKGRLIADRSTD